jgi:hypothetical protein
MKNKELTEAEIIALMDADEQVFREWRKEFNALSDEEKTARRAAIHPNRIAIFERWQSEANVNIPLNEPQKKPLLP